MRQQRTYTAVCDENLGEGAMVASGLAADGLDGMNGSAAGTG